MMVPTRRQRFKAAVTLTGQSMTGAARSLGVSYNHLCLVLDGTRKGSARLEEGIAHVLELAMSLLAADLAAARTGATVATTAQGAATAATSAVRDAPRRRSRRP